MTETKTEISMEMGTEAGGASRTDQCWWVQAASSACPAHCQTQSATSHAAIGRRCSRKTPGSARRRRSAPDRPPGTARPLCTSSCKTFRRPVRRAASCHISRDKSRTRANSVVASPCFDIREASWTSGSSRSIFRVDLFDGAWVVAGARWPRRGNILTSDSVPCSFATHLHFCPHSCPSGTWTCIHIPRVESACCEWNGAAAASAPPRPEDAPSCTRWRRHPRL